MKTEQTGFKDLLVLTPKVFHDDRGYFFESFNEKTFEEATGLKIDFVQDNESFSAKGVVRGLHFQHPPFAQDKLVRVSRGSVLDVVVDLRKDQPTFGKSYSLELSAENKKMLFVPKGFAHGFAVLEDDTLFTYKCSAFYSREHDDVIRYDDAKLAINWPFDEPRVSEKDRAAQLFDDLNSPF